LDLQALYREFCDIYAVSLYHQPWWLDAVCGPEHWSACVSTDKGGTVTGILPYYVTKRWGIKVLLQPPLTTYAGPLLFYPDHPEFKLNSRYTFEKKVQTQLIAQLPKYALFRQHFRTEVINWMGFYQAGFQQSTRYTYTLDTLVSMNHLIEGVKSGTRTNLKKAEKYSIISIEPRMAATIFDFYTAALKQKGLRLPCTKQVFLPLHAVLAKREQVACFVAFDREGHIPQAGLYLVFDAHSAGILLSGVSAEFRHTAVMHGLIWAAIEFCHAKKLALDFEGSMEPGVEHLYRSFGATMVPYFKVWKWLNG